MDLICRLESETSRTERKIIERLCFFLSLSARKNTAKNIAKNTAHAIKKEIKKSLSILALCQFRWLHSLYGSVLGPSLLGP